LIEKALLGGKIYAKSVKLGTILDGLILGFFGSWETKNIYGSGRINGYASYH